MEVVHSRCAGMDVSKQDAKVCVRLIGPRGKVSREVTTWDARTSSILELARALLDAQVTCVAMEATGDYWKPFYYLMHSEGVPVMLVNARQARQIPGRKTDVSDSAWLADLAAHGLVRASFVPDPELLQLRDLVRTRTSMVKMRGQEMQRVEKLLESASIKLSAAISHLVDGASGRRMLDALVRGETDPRALAAMADPRIKATTEELVEALTGRFTEHHQWLLGMHLGLIDELSGRVEELDARIDSFFDHSGPEDGFRARLAVARENLATIPGVSTTAAEQILAEIGPDVSRFPTPGHLASWAGVTPGARESAGKKKPARRRDGNTHLQRVLGTTAGSIAMSKGTYLSARYRRLVARRGPATAKVAIQHKVIESVWHILTTGQPYLELGEDYYQKRRPGAVLAKAVAQLRKAGYQIKETLDGNLTILPTPTPMVT